MATKKFNYKPIMAGFEWKMLLTVNSAVAVFPEGCELKAQVRVAPGEPVLGLLTTGNGKIVRVDDNRVEFHIDGNTSARWEEGSVMWDLVRTDIEPDQHLGIRVEAKVRISLTAR